MQMAEGWKDSCEGWFFFWGGGFSWVMEGMNEGKVMDGVTVWMALNPDLDTRVRNQKGAEESRW